MKSGYRDATCSALDIARASMAYQYSDRRHGARLSAYFKGIGFDREHDVFKYRVDHGRER